MINTVLAVNIPQIGASRDTSVDPARGRHLRDQVARLLNVLFQNRDHRSILLAEELLRHRATLLAHAHLLGVEQQTLKVLVATTPCHVGHRKEGACLGTDLAPVRLKTRLVAHKRISINRRIVVTVSFAGIDKELIDGQRIHTPCVRDQVGGHVTTGAHRLGIKRLNATQVIAGVRHPIDIKRRRLHVAHSGIGLEKEDG